jgi:hypothetical protein
MSNQTRSTADVRNAVAFVPVTSIQMRFSEAEAEMFDRWLKAHDAVVAATALEEAANHAAASMYTNYMGNSAVGFLRQIAAEYRAKAGRGTPEPSVGAQSEAAAEWEYGFYDTGSPKQIWWYAFGGIVGFTSPEMARHAAVKSVWGEAVIVRRKPGRSDW